MQSRVDFISQMLIEELFDKRLSALKSFREGLNHFGLLNLIKQDPDVWRPMFTREKGDGVYAQLSANEFLSLIQSTPESDAEKNAYSLFVQFLNKAENLTGK
jgi:hypothetical protein